MKEMYGVGKVAILDKLPLIGTRRRPTKVSTLKSHSTLLFYFMLVLVLYNGWKDLQLQNLCVFFLRLTVSINV